MKALSANLRWLFLEWPFLERIDVAARMGFRAVDFSLPYDCPAVAIRERLDATGIGFVYMLTPSGDWDAGEMGVAALPGREREFRDGVSRAIDYACVIGAPLLHAASGIVPAGVDPARCRDVYRENLAFAADLASKAGLQIGIEPLCEAAHPRYFLLSTDDALATIDTLARPNLRLILDAHHAAMQHGAIEPVLERHHARIAHFQVANPPGRHQPGEGELDFDHLFDVLERIGFDGWVSAEYRPLGGTVASLGWARRFGVAPEQAGPERSARTHDTGGDDDAVR
jgi:hydroxypyruvate isomerase